MLFKLKLLGLTLQLGREETGDLNNKPLQSKYGPFKAKPEDIEKRLAAYKNEVSLGGGVTQVLPSPSATRGLQATFDTVTAFPGMDGRDTDAMLLVLVKNDTAMLEKLEKDFGEEKIRRFVLVNQRVLNPPEPVKIISREERLVPIYEKIEHNETLTREERALRPFGGPKHVGGWLCCDNWQHYSVDEAALRPFRGRDDFTAARIGLVCSYCTRRYAYNHQTKKWEGVVDTYRVTGGTPTAGSSAPQFNTPTRYSKLKAPLISKAYEQKRA